MPPSIAALTVDLCKTISIAPMSGDILAQGAPPGDDWSLVTIPKASGKVAMRLIPMKNVYRGAWELTSRPGEGRALPVYFLPWRAKRIVKLEIGSDLPLFATAGISGCSVFTTGPGATPTVYHAGCAEGDLATYDGDAEIKRAASPNKAELFWQLLLTKQLVPNAMEDKGWSAVGKSMYLDDGSGETARAKAAIRTIVASHRSDKIVWNPNYRGVCWGAYLGFCSGGKWNMYLQENLTFYYSHKDTKREYSTSLPIALTQVFPRGKEKTNLINPAPTRINDPFTPSDTVREGWSG